jgi:hypothetical protein
MWQGINKYYFWLLWFLTFLAGIAFYCMIFSPDVRKYLFRLFSDNLSSFSTIFQWSITILLIVILVILWVEFRRMKAYEKTYQFPASEGEASIAQPTLNRFIKSVIRTYDSVRHVSVASAISGDSLGVIAKIRVTDTVPLKTLIDDIQHTVRMRIRETFGHDIIADLRIEVTDIHPTEHSPSPAGQPADTALSAFQQPGQEREPEQTQFISVTGARADDEEHNA